MGKPRLRSGFSVLNSQIAKFAFVFASLLSMFAAIQVVYAEMASDAPVLLTPADGTVGTVDNYPPLGVPVFTWEAVEEAESYRIQFSQDIGFSDTNTKDFTTNNPFYMPPTLSGLPNKFPDGAWYWRVRVEKPEASEYSEVWIFEKNWAYDNAPELTAPLEGEELEFFDTPSFSWTAVPGAAQYMFQIAASYDGFAAPVYNVETLARVHQPLKKLANGTYYWRVVPLDASGTEGTPSNVRSFDMNYAKVPDLIAPEDDAVTTFTPTFRWTAVEGAEIYRLQYSTSNDFPPTRDTKTVETRNTTYTPETSLANNRNFYWRVQTESGNSISEWSEVRSFLKQWYIKPVLLTPTNNYQHQRFPIFSWTPVPSASYYLIEIAINDPNMGRTFITDKSANPFYTPTKYEDQGPGGESNDWYWRVTPYDVDGNAGQTSDTFAYKSLYNDISPDQVYPLYYYEPNNFPPPFTDVEMNPYEDRTVALPLFVWTRPLTPAFEVGAGQTLAEGYRLEVSENPNFNPVVWDVDTENSSAAPTQSDPFTPDSDTIYYWRVCPLQGGTCVEDSNTPALPYWSQVWATKIDTSMGFDSTGNTVPEPLNPVDGAELAELTPWFQWLPVDGATAYEIQISLDSDFNEIVDQDTVVYPIYSPTDAFGLRNLNALDFSTYYWRVRAITGTSKGAWNDTRRFQVASQSQWLDTRTAGAAENQLEIGSDTGGDSASDYDLTKLYAAQSRTDWHFGFDVPASPSTDVTYAIYLDIDHENGSGGTFDPLGYDVSTIAAHQPEYVIYIYQQSGSVLTSNVHIYGWNGQNWNAYRPLHNAGGGVFLDSGYLEIRVPSTEIGNVQVGGSYAISVLSFSAASSNSKPIDSVPHDPNIPGGAEVSRFSSVTEKVTLLAPFTNLGDRPEGFPSMQPYFFDWPVAAPYAGHDIEVARDEGFTEVSELYKNRSNSPHWAQSNQFVEDDLGGDDTYYWRMRPMYKPGSQHIAGVWSEPARFERIGFIPKNLKENVTFATPTFSWDIVEGAEDYEIQIDTDPNFGSPDIRDDTAQTSYTPVKALANGTYYWRVRAERYGGTVNAWSQTQEFTLALPYPTNLRHLPSGVVSAAPTLCWDPIQKNDTEGNPVLTAWKYKIQISQDPSFSTVFEAILTEQSCYTPLKGYADGTYYWRAAMIDGQNHASDYSPAVEFTKQYNITSLISPVDGSVLAQTPIFEWTPVDGAASYSIQISEYATFERTYDSGKLNFTKFTPKKVYENGVTYYWRVAIIDADGKYGPYTDAIIIVDEDGLRNKVYLPFVSR